MFLLGQFRRIYQDYRGTDGPIVVSHTDPILEFFHQQAASELGYQTVDCNGYNQEGFCPNEENVKDGVRCSSASCYLRPALHRPNLQVSLKSHITKILFENGTARGVEFIKENKTVRVYVNKEVILSAGSIGSPHILLLSGIGPKQHLDAMKIPVVADRPVGKYYKDHVSLLFRYTTNSSLSDNKAKMADIETKLDYILHRKGLYNSRWGGHVFVHFDEGRGRKDYPDGQIEFLGSPHEFVGNDYTEDVQQQFQQRIDPNGFGLLLYFLHPKSIGNIELSSGNPLEQAKIDPRYLSNDDDVTQMLKFIRIIRRFEETKSWKSINAKVVRLDAKNHCGDLQFDTDEYWRCVIRHFLRAGGHLTSTCRMGSSTDPTAVVDPELRVIGVRNLRVADASVMRNPPSGNTNAPTMMIGEKAAAMIKQSRK